CAVSSSMFFFFQAEDGIRDRNVTGVQTCALPISLALGRSILAEGRTVMLQPEIPELTAGREKALYMVDRRFTHAVAKGALLARGGGLRGGSYRETPAQVPASDAERSFAEQVLANRKSTRLNSSHV